MNGCFSQLAVVLQASKHVEAASEQHGRSVAAAVNPEPLGLSS